MTKYVTRFIPCAMFIACLCGVINSFAHGAAVGFVEASRGAGCTDDIECDDGLPCTIDTCDFPASGPVGAGVCQHSPVPNGQPGGVGGPGCAQQFGLLCGGCDDGVFCNGAETCQGGVWASGTPPCTGGQVCSESFNMCQDLPCSSATDCANALIVGAAFAAEAAMECNGRETCVSGVCVAATNPCGAGALCGEKQCSQGAAIDVCITDEDCATVGGTCSLLVPVCKTR